MGLGDLEALCDQAPIEIGNYVWKDLNHDGIQNPNEPVIAGVTVGLYSNPDGLPNTGDEVLLANTITDGNGQYLFNNANVSGGVKPNTNYVVAINPGQGVLTGLQATLPDQGSKDTIDSDGVPQTGSGPVNGQVAVYLKTGNPGDNDHTYDFGFWQKPLDACVITCDLNNDGRVDKSDIAAIILNRGKKVSPPGAPNSGDCYVDAVISVNDAWKCKTYCTSPNCVEGP